MEEKTNLETLTQKVSDNLLDSIYIVEILEEMFEDCGGKEGFLLSSLKNNIKAAFETTEDCRNIISCP
jgi:hypothetical protein